MGPVGGPVCFSLEDFDESGPEGAGPQFVDVGEIGLTRLLYAVTIGIHEQMTGDGGPTAVVWSNGRVTALKIPGDPIFSWASAINERGDIAGYLTPSPPANDAEANAAISERTIPFVLRATGG